MYSQEGHVGFAKGLHVFLFFSPCISLGFSSFSVQRKVTKETREKEKSQAMNGEPTGKKCGIRTCRPGNRKDLL
jgi:hypothetical protein